MFTLSSSNNDIQAKLDALDRSQAVIEFETDGTIITANKNFCGAIGYSLDEIKGKHHSMFVDPEEANGAEYRNFWSSLAAGEFKSAEFKRVAKGGREIWIQASYNPILDKNGKAYKVVKFATDITDKKLEYAGLLGRVNAISRSQAVIEFDLAGNIQNANENFLGAVGYSLDEIKGKHHRMFMDPEEANSAAYQQFWDALALGEFQAGEYKRLGKGGNEIWIQASYNPIMDMNGNPYKVVKFAIDRTQAIQDRLRREEAQKEINTGITEIRDAVMNASSQATEAASASGQTSQNVQAVAGGLEELASSVQEINQQVTNALEI